MYLQIVLHFDSSPLILREASGRRQRVKSESGEQPHE